MTENKIGIDRISTETEMGRKKGKLRIAVIMTVVSLAVLCMSRREMTGIHAAEEVVTTGPEWAIDMVKAPAVAAESAILMDVDTGVILYEKDIHKKQYPASVTKLLTCIVAAENSELTDIVTFSHEAVFGIERGSSHIGIDEGEQLTMKDAYYGALLESANEVSAGIAEHVGGSKEGFAAMMNEKVKELGGNDSNFVNANGLHDDNHYTSAYDMALIGRAFAQNEMLLEISGTEYYRIDPTPTQKDTIDLRNHHRMLPGCQLSGARPYEYMIGGKTGYTVAAKSTLVTFAKKGGHRLVCVVLKDKSPYHYMDTIALFDYGFAAYEDTAVNAQIEEKAMALRAEETAKTEAENEEEQSAAGETQAGEDSADRAEDGTAIGGSESGIEEAKTEENSGSAEKKISLTVILTGIVSTVVLATVAVCAFVFYKYYQEEQERKRRRAEIMARHRARREEVGIS